MLIKRIINRIKRGFKGGNTVKLTATEKKLIEEFDIKKSREYIIVRDSALFDSDYYLKNNKDVSDAGMDPVEHYVIFGWKENRVPSQTINSLMSRAAYQAVVDKNVNPVIYLDTHPQEYKALCSNKATQAAAIVQHNEIGTTSFHMLPMLNVMMYSYKQFKEKANSRIKPQHVLVVSHTLENTGAPRAAFLLAKTLKECGHIPIVLSFKNGPIKNDFAKEGIPVLLEPLSTFSKKLDSTTLRFLNGFDCIILNTIVSLQIAEKIKQTSAYKIAWIHEGKFEFEKSASAIDYKKNFSCVSEVFAGGYYAKRFIDQYLEDGRESKVLLYGIESSQKPEEETENIEVFERTDDKIKFSVLGTICERKGQDVVLDALELLPPELTDKIQIDFVGSVREEAAYKSLTQKAEQYPFINYIPEMKLDALLSYMASDMDVLLVPSRDDPMPIVATEAMRLSKVVAVSKNTGTYGFITNGVNGYVFDELTPESVAETIKCIIEDKSKFSSIGESVNKVYTDNFTLDTFKNNIAHIMNNLNIISRGLWNDLL